MRLSAVESLWALRAFITSVAPAAVGTQLSQGLLSVAPVVLLLLLLLPTTMTSIRTITTLIIATIMVTMVEILTFFHEASQLEVIWVLLRLTPTPP